MYSNFITPPDFVDDDLHTVTVIDATVDEVESLARMCERSDEMYNVYLYKKEMNDLDWLQQAIARSAIVIVRSTDSIDLSDKVYCYGDTGIRSYFESRTKT